MSIEVAEEPADFAGHFGGVYEKCRFCRKETMFWHEKTNTPVCEDCAASHDESDIQKRKATVDFSFLAC